MIIYPAIDLRGGQVVRLRQGRADEQVTYSDDPAAVAARWQAEGATWLHVVDLDGALGEQERPNAVALARIRAAVKISVQFGGGLRDMESIARAFEVGVNRVVIGTMAVENEEALAAVVRRFGGERIVAAMDTQEGRLATHGWRTLTNLDAFDFGKRMRELGIHLALVTDIARDGMLTGVDADSLSHLARETGLRVIASGGIATLDDLVTLAQHQSDGIEGAIVGRALYSGVLNLGDAIRAVRPHS
jgi:phosphoribosylformimino-5-aminoimidazole carboxamide ribotide isomerase